MKDGGRFEEMKRLSRGVQIRRRPEFVDSDDVGHSHPHKLLFMSKEFYKTRRLSFCSVMGLLYYLLFISQIKIWKHKHDHSRKIGI